MEMVIPLGMFYLSGVAHLDGIPCTLTFEIMFRQNSSGARLDWEVQRNDENY
ncbi:MAG: hypothetical protein LBF43_01770 [Puniceicoccales bacterium]|nr:hypothetical protein [Puniceicoccales bacterium]